MTTKTNLARQIREKADRLGITIGVAESLTGGWVASSIVAIPGSSKILRGGIVAYQSSVKHELLGVDLRLLSKLGAVNQEVASSMAEGALRLFGADIAVATTGFAGPEQKSDGNNEQGTVFVGIAGSKSGTLVRQIALDGDRTVIRSKATNAALEAILEALETWI